MLPSVETSTLSRRLNGFHNTPFLWDGLLEGLEMYAWLQNVGVGVPEIDLRTHIRLGKLIELFVLFEFEQNEAIQILKSNVQIFRDQVTLGELDCLIKRGLEYIHLEIVYKFYLYDPAVSQELDRWVGPNKNDSLVLKLRKLKEKQLPLLHRPETALLLDDLELKSSMFKQQVYFKAQLFVPYNLLGKSFPLINKNGVKGFYIRPNDLDLFENHQFYIPSKLDWLVEPHSEVEWLLFSSFKNEISEYCANQKSPLCWMKSDTMELQKFFVVWWD